MSQSYFALGLGGSLLLIPMAMGQSSPEPPLAPPGLQPIPVIELPREFEAAPGSFITVAAKTSCPRVQWLALDPGLTLLPADLLRDSAKMVCLAAAPGRYRLLAYTAAGDTPSHPAICTLVVGSPPSPPAPPAPAPPSDPLLTELQQIFASDRSQQKLAQRITLANLYRTAGHAALRDTTVTTTGQLFAKLRAASKLLLPDDALQSIRERLARHYSTEFAQSDAPLNESNRARASQLFDRVAALLDALR